MQTRPQRCIFMCPTFSGRPKGRNVLMRRNPVPVSVLVLWLCTTICFQKTLEDPHGLFKKDRDTHIGRHNDYWQNKGRDYSSTRYSHSFTSVPGICYKSEKVSDNTSLGDRICGNDRQFKGNEEMKKLQSIKQMCQDMCQNAEMVVSEQTKMLGHLT